MELRRCRLTDAVAAPLLAGLTEEYGTRYGATDEMMRASADQFDPPGGTFVVLVDDGVTVAGGGVRALEPGVCEEKRMWTHPDHRRKGLATAVLDALEDIARELGYEQLRLETGPAQPEAIGLYESRGYRRIPVFGHYPLALAFERDLTD
jgi:GNAT superfamily N-acetyltransferase